MNSTVQRGVSPPSTLPLLQWTSLARGHRAKRPFAPKQRGRFACGKMWNMPYVSVKTALTVSVTDCARAQRRWGGTQEKKDYC